MVYRCSKCKKEVEVFTEKYVSHGVVEHGADCKACELVDASNLYLCLECVDESREP